jgi:hypothetical protein
MKPQKVLLRRGRETAELNAWNDLGAVAFNLRGRIALRRPKTLYAVSDARTCAQDSARKVYLLFGKFVIRRLCARVLGCCNPQATRTEG